MLVSSTRAQTSLCSAVISVLRTWHTHTHTHTHTSLKKREKQRKPVDGVSEDGAGWAGKNRRPTFSLAPGLAALEQSVIMGIRIIYSSLTTLFAHLIGPKPVAW
jgi:hypothetical protein